MAQRLMSHRGQGRTDEKEMIAAREPRRTIAINSLLSAARSVVTAYIGISSFSFSASVFGFAVCLKGYFVVIESMILFAC